MSKIAVLTAESDYSALLRMARLNGRYLFREKFSQNADGRQTMLAGI